VTTLPCTFNPALRQRLANALGSLQQSAQSARSEAAGTLPKKVESAFLVPRSISAGRDCLSTAYSVEKLEIGRPVNFS
jgi:hypothetical protein